MKLKVGILTLSLVDLVYFAIFMLFIFGLFFSRSLFVIGKAQARTATADTSGSWGTAANWDGPDTLPVAADAVVIPTGINITLNGVYGGAGFISVNVQAGGTLTIPVDANSGLVLAGDSATGFTVAGTLTTAGGAAVGAGFTCTISITPATDGGSGAIFNGNVTLIGATKDHFKVLAADVGEWAASGDIATVGNIPSITLDAMPNGWRDNDLITLAPTGRTYSHWDTALLNGNPASATLNVDGWQGTAPLYNLGAATKSAWNHQGAGTPTQARAEVLNLTRNVKIYSTNAALRTYVSIGATAVVTMNYVECYSVGITTTNKYGITFNTSTGTASLTGVVVHDSNSRGYQPAGSTTTGTISLTNCISWTTVSHGYNVQPTALTTGNQICTSCVAGNVTGASLYGFLIADVGSTFPGSRAIGNISHGFYVSESAAVVDGMLDNVVSHSNGGSNIAWASGEVSQATSLTGAVLWRATGQALIGLAGAAFDVWFTNLVAFGNTTQEVATNGIRIVLETPTFAADAAFTNTYDCAADYGDIIILGGTIKGKQSIRIGSRVTTIGTTHTTFVAPSFILGADDGQSSAQVNYRYNNTPDDNRFYYKYGSVLSNAVTRHTASGFSYQHLPIGGVGIWFRPNIPYEAQAVANVPNTVTAWVYVDAAYNGTAKPRIVALGGWLQGIDNDVIGTSHSGAVGQWELLSVTVNPTESGTLKFVIEGQGTAPGSYYVDDEGSVVPAFVPLAPTVNATSDTSLTVIINTNGNIDSNEYAISCDADATFLNYSTNACEAIADDGDHWRTYANWGGVSGVADTGLLAGSAHTYKVKARNANKVETALSGSTAQTTLAAPPAPGGGSSFSLLAPSHITQKLIDSLKTADAAYRTAVSKATKEFQAAIKAAKTANERKKAVAARNRAIHEAYMVRIAARQLATKTFLADLAAWRREQESIINVYKKTVKSTISQYQENKKSVLGAYKTNFDSIKQTPGNVTEKGNLYKAYSQKMIQTRKEFQSAFQSALKSYLLSLKAHYL